MTDESDEADEASYIEDVREEFRACHEREPYSSHELSRWIVKQQMMQAASIAAQLKSQGCEIVDGQIVLRSDATPEQRAEWERLRGAAS